MKKIIFLLSLLMLVFNVTYTEETDIEEILYKQWDFSVKDGSVYYGKQKIPNLDYSSFEKLNDYYLRDKNGIYSANSTIIVTGWETLADYENFQNENWYEDKEIKQWYGLEMEAEKISQIGQNNYVLDGQYIFGNGYAVNRGEVIYSSENSAFRMDMRTLKIIDTDLLQCGENDFECKLHRNILVKDKNGVYGIIDGADRTKVYRIKSVNALSFEKIGTRIYKDKNKTYTLEDIDKKAVRVKGN
ncbi:DKNYY domain-containing protein [Sebaldella sp. S0638]|uniref:DKNYY domain-containing protein n=1 Tax=Sebaldella sp. S0638 TaxID=2957809 RepID=UPI00209DF5F3|nr:DKNYY domain-containing protein [Sebaldella sp. S0638]MCP1223553.1 DKNYY domain-containing protein [Sebaldella sp. S0638]